MDVMMCVYYYLKLLCFLCSSSLCFLIPLQMFWAFGYTHNISLRRTIHGLHILPLLIPSTKYPCLVRVPRNTHPFAILAFCKYGDVASVQSHTFTCHRVSSHSSYIFVLNVFLFSLRDVVFFPTGSIYVSSLYISLSLIPSTICRPLSASIYYYSQFLYHLFSVFSRLVMHWFALLFTQITRCGPSPIYSSSIWPWLTSS